MIVPAAPRWSIPPLAPVAAALYEASRSRPASLEGMSHRAALRARSASVHPARTRTGRSRWRQCREARRRRARRSDAFAQLVGTSCKSRGDRRLQRGWRSTVRLARRRRPARRAGPRTAGRADRAGPTPAAPGSHAKREPLTGVLRAAASPGPGAARRARTRARPQLAQRSSAGSTREEHDGSRLEGRAPLELIDALQGGLAFGVAGESVDGVGGISATPSPSTSRQAQLGPAGTLHPSRRVERSRTMLTPLPPTRSIPARSRSARTDGKPAARISSPTAAACPAPISSASRRTEARAAAWPSAAGSTSSPSSPANSAEAGSWRRISGASSRSISRPGT